MCTELLIKCLAFVASSSSSRRSGSGSRLQSGSHQELCVERVIRSRKSAGGCGCGCSPALSSSCSSALWHCHCLLAIVRATLSFPLSLSASLSISLPLAAHKSCSCIDATGIWMAMSLVALLASWFAVSVFQFFTFPVIFLLFSFCLCPPLLT